MLLVDSTDFEYSESEADTSVVHQVRKTSGLSRLPRLPEHCY
jgi:hypothetical protein